MSKFETFHIDIAETTNGIFIELGSKVLFGATSCSIV